MDHRRYCQPALTAGDPRLHFHDSTTPSSLVVPEPPFYILNPNPSTPISHTNFLDTTVSPPPTYSPQPAAGWNTLITGTGINLNQGTCRYAQSTTVRWPRQETLTLLEIRSRLDHCFKEATSSNHKAPLWDEISRIMKEEYGYQRSGRKCKEKFENLYKYYKKTKEGKVGKTDGKHYRFFRQLEALVGNQHDHPNTGYPSSQSNHSSGNNTPSDHDDEFKKKELIAAIEESIESHFMKLMVKQEQWCEKILCTIEQKEQERVILEEEWQKQEGARLDREYEAWASHIARIKTRDESLLEALQNLIKVRSSVGSSNRNKDEPVSSSKDWIEPEISSLIHIRTNKECKFQDVDEEHGDRLWEEVAYELSLLGYNRSEKVCKETWDKICVDFNKRKMEQQHENTISREVSSRTSNNAMNIECGRSWEAM